MIERVLMGWSGGKDSALSLHELQGDPGVEVAGLLTTLTEGYDRVSMHAVRRTLLEQQAEAVGVPLHKVYIPQNCTNEIYEARMREALEAFQAQRITTNAFGDLFLEDVRQYRERNLARIGMKAIFPIWGQDTHALARSFVDMGFKAILTCVDPRHLDRSFAGRFFDGTLLEDLPPEVDPCGENGEFHTFVFDGPIFQHPIQCAVGEVVERDGFVFCDVIPAA